MGTVTLAEQTAPSTPAAGAVIVYAKSSDHNMYWKDSTGTEHAMGGSGGSSGGGTFSGSLAFSVNANALTIAIKDGNGNDPSAGSPVTVLFRSATASSALNTAISLTSANSLTVSAGATLGVANSVPFRAWIVAFNDSGTVRIGVINCLSTTAGAGAGRDVTAIYPLLAWGIASSTAVSGSSTAAATFYTGTGVTNVAYTVLGYVTYESGLATAGNYASTPTRGDLWTIDMALPGQRRPLGRVDSGSVATGSTTIPFDNTIPQSTEGDQYLSLAVTPTSAANALRISGELTLTTASGSGNVLTVTLMQDATANALKAASVGGSTANIPGPGPIGAFILSNTTSSTTFKLRAGCNVAGTTTFNGSGGGQIYNGTYNSFLEIEEVMA